MATLSFGPLICVKLTLMGTLVVFPFPKTVQLMTSGISGGEKVWTSFFLFLFFYIYLCVHSHVHDYITHSVDSEMKRGEIKTHSEKGSSSLYWNVAERSEKPNNSGLWCDVSGGLSLLRCSVSTPGVCCH